MDNPRHKLGGKFKNINNAFERSLNHSLAELDITSSQSFLLGYIVQHDEKPPCQHDIEVRFNIKHPTATGILKRLAAKGFVVFLPDENDKRLKRVLATDTGREASKKVTASLDYVDSKFSSVLTSEELECLNNILDKLILNSDELFETVERKNAND